MVFEEATRITAIQKGRKRGNPALFRPCYGHINRPGGCFKKAAKGPQKAKSKGADFSKVDFSGPSAICPLCLSALKAFDFLTLFEDAAATRPIRS